MIAGAILVLGGFVVGAGILVSNAIIVSNATVRVGYLPLVTVVLSGCTIVSGIVCVTIGSKQIQSIYNNRRLRRS